MSECFCHDFVRGDRVFHNDYGFGRVVSVNSILIYVNFFEYDPDDNLIIHFKFLKKDGVK